MNGGVWGMKKRPSCLSARRPDPLCAARQAQSLARAMNGQDALWGNYTTLQRGALQHCSSSRAVRAEARGTSELRKPGGQYTSCTKRRKGDEGAGLS